MTCSRRGYEQVCGCISHNGFLTRAGYRALDKAASQSYLDIEGSVSALRRDETMFIFDDEVLDEQYRRFLSSSGGV